MKKFTGFALAAVMATSLMACSTFAKNELADACANPTTFLANVPAGVLTPAQQLDALNKLCVGTFGTQAAPVTAPGMKPAL